MCFTRKFKLNEKQPPFDVVEAFAMYTDKGTHMSAPQFRRFLVEFQSEDPGVVTEAHAVRLVEDIIQRRRHLSHLSKSTKKGLSLTTDDFFYFLFSDDLNGPLNTQVDGIFFSFNELYEKFKTWVPGEFVI